MSLENTQAKYEILIQKVGSAIPAAQELDQVAASSARAALAARNATNSMVHLKEASLLTRESFRTLHATSALLGGHFFTLTLAGQAAVDSMKLIRGAAAATGTSLGAMGVATAGAATAVGILLTAWQTMAAQLDAQKSEQNLGEALNKQTAAASKTLNLLREQGKITQQQWLALNNTLVESIGNYEKTKAAILAIRAVDPSKAQTEDEKKLADLRATLTEETLDGYRKETFAATQAYEKRKQQLDDLYNDMIRFNGGKKDTGTLGLDQAANDRAYAAVIGRIDATRQQAELEKTLSFIAAGSSDDRIKQAEFEFTKRIDLYQHLAAEYPALEEQMTNDMRDASLKRLEIIRAENDKVKLNIKTTGELVKTAEENFASGMAQAIVEFVSGTKSAKDAFLDFARTFLSKTAEMIAEQELLKAIKSVSNWISGSAGAAEGGIFPRYAANGIQTVSSPTYFPRFNVVAGEAGAEMLTVLARPRRMALGGMEAVVGDAGGRRLAIADPAALGGGRVVIELSHSEQSEARIISNSVRQAEIHLTRQAQSNTPFRKALTKNR